MYCRERFIKYTEEIEGTSPGTKRASVELMLPWWSADHEDEDPRVCLPHRVFGDV